MTRDAIQNGPAPWRAVVKTERLKTSAHMVVVNWLECGHAVTIRGEKALDAKYATRRRCKACAAGRRKA